MDRYVIRQPRGGGEYPEGNQMIAFSATTSSTGNNITIPESGMVHYGAHNVQNTNVGHLGADNEQNVNVGHLGAYNAQNTSVGRLGPYNAQNASVGHVRVHNAQNVSVGYLGAHNVLNASTGRLGVHNVQNASVGHLGANNAQNASVVHLGAHNAHNASVGHLGAHNVQNASVLHLGAPNAQNSSVGHLGAQNGVTSHNVMHVYSPTVVQRQTEFLTGIDTMYLAAHSDSNNTAYIVTGRSIQQGATSMTGNALGKDNQYPNNNVSNISANNRNFIEVNTNNCNFNYANPNNRNSNDANRNNCNFNGGDVSNRNFNRAKVPKRETVRDCQTQEATNTFENQQKFHSNTPANKKQTETDLVKPETHNQVRTRAEMLKELHKTGPRVFSGPVEKILKWHKPLQEIGIIVFYELVGKCVNVRPGESCAKNLVVRDANGPAIQVIYYEIDFMLPELKPPCTVRVIGRMMPGTNRLQAFNVRLATGDDVAMLPRRAAVAAHHVANLCKDYGVEVMIFK